MNFLLEFRRHIAFIFFLALAVRLFHLFALLQSPMADTVVLDARYYFNEAGRILGYFTDHNRGVPFMNLGYPYVIALFCSVLGYHVSVMLFVQAFFGALTAISIFAATFFISRNARAAVLAGTVAALYSGAIFYDGLVLTPSFINLLLSFSLVLIIVGLDRQNRWLLLSSGICIGMAALIRANALMLLIVWAGAVYIVTPSGRKLKTALTITLLIGGAIVTGPVIIFNGIVHGEWVMISANSGMNFWVGNHSTATGMYKAPAFVGSQSAEAEQEAYLTEARKLSGDSTLTLSGSSTFWRNAVLTNITGDPVRWFRLLFVKLLYSLNRYEIQTNTAMDFVSRFSSVLSFTPIRFAFLLPVGMAGIIVLLMAANRSAGWMLMLAVIVFIATNVIFFVSGEYRHPASLALCIGAGVFLEKLWTSALRQKTVQKNKESFSWIFVPGIAGIIFLTTTLLPFSEIERISDPFYSYTNYAQAQYRKIEQGHTPSREEFQRASQLLRIAEPKPHQQLILWEVQCRTHFLFAVSYNDVREAKNALIVAQQIFSEDFREIAHLYDQQFLTFLLSNVPAMIREIVKTPSLSSDPELRSYTIRAHELFTRNMSLRPYLPVPR